MTKVYVAGPFTADSKEAIQENVETAFHHATILKREGFTPFIPHLLFYYERWHKNTFGYFLEYEEAMEWDEAFLTDCDVLYVIARSPGVDREIERAKELGIPIHYASDKLEDLHKCTLSLKS